MRRRSFRASHRLRSNSGGRNEAKGRQQVGQRNASVTRRDTTPTSANEPKRNRTRPTPRTTNAGKRVTGPENARTRLGRWTRRITRVTKSGNNVTGAACIRTRRQHTEGINSLTENEFRCILIVNKIV